jgi:hypothetical protein
MNLCKTKLKRTQYIYDNTKEPYVNPIVPHERTIIGKEKIWTSEPFALIQSITRSCRQETCANRSHGIDNSSNKNRGVAGKKKTQNCKCKLTEKRNTT